MLQQSDIIAHEWRRSGRLVLHAGHANQRVPWGERPDRVAEGAKREWEWGQQPLQRERKRKWRRDGGGQWLRRLACRMPHAHLAEPRQQ